MTLQVIESHPCFEPLENRTFLSADSFEVDNTLATAKPITTDGVAQTHSLDVVGDKDHVVFTIASATMVDIQTLGPAGGDTRIMLFNSSGLQIAQNDNVSSTNKYSKITMNLAAGTYKVRITGPTILNSYKVLVSANLNLANFLHLTPTAQWNATGIVAIDGTDYNATASYQVVGTPTLHGLPTYKLQRSVSFNSETHTEYACFSTSTGYMLQKEGGIDSDVGDVWQQTMTSGCLFMPSTIQVGKTYSYTRNYSGSDISGPDAGNTWTGSETGTFQVVGWENVTTPAGTFQTLKIVHDFTWSDVGGDTEHHIETAWYARNIGVVQTAAAWTSAAGTNVSYVFDLTSRVA